MKKILGGITKKSGEGRSPKLRDSIVDTFYSCFMVFMFEYYFGIYVENIMYVILGIHVMDVILVLYVHVNGSS